MTSSAARSICSRRCSPASREPAASREPPMRSFMSRSPPLRAIVAASRLNVQSIFRRDRIHGNQGNPGGKGAGGYGGEDGTGGQGGASGQDGQEGPAIRTRGL